jgi:GNAT superfamily N-acetyltransferase
MKETSGGITYEDRPDLTNERLNELYAASWPNHTFCDFEPVLERSLTFECAFFSEQLVGFVYLAWDGGQHAFLLDATVRPEFRRKGIGTELVKRAVRQAAGHGLEWVHVDFEPHLREFYSRCGFISTDAGLIRLSS